MTRITEGKGVIIVNKKWGSIVEHNMTFVKNSKYLEFNVDVRTGLLQRDQELVCRFNFGPVDKWWSDTNGLETLRRSYIQDRNEPTAANVYPMVYSAYGRSEDRHVNIITNRTIGFGLLSQPGNIELHIHRRTSQDDGRGVDESLDDLDFGYLNLKVTIELQPNKDAHLTRTRAIHHVNFPSDLYQVTSPFTPLKPTWSAMSQELPANIHLLSFEKKSQYSPETFIRLAHIFEQGHHDQYSTRTTLDLTKHFASIHFDKIDLVTLTGSYLRSHADPTKITLDPMDINTYNTTLK